MNLRAHLAMASLLVAASVVSVPAVFDAAHAASQQLDALPTRFDSPFEPQHINPDIAVISPTPGFEQGRYDIRMTLGETTLYDPSGRFARNYVGEFVLQALELPTDDFARLAGKSFSDIADDSSASWIEFRQVRVEPGQEPFAQLLNHQYQSSSGMNTHER